MTRILPIALALVLVAAVALADTRDTPRVAVVLAGPAAQRADLVSQVKRADVALRVPRSAADQLGTTHVLAADHYATVVVIGADRKLALDPVTRRYPRTRFVVTTADPKVLQTALEAARR
jgi:hypothetical protein